MSLSYKSLLASIAFLASSIPAMAASTPSPEELIERSNQGRAQMIEATNAVQLVIPGFSDSTQLFPYIEVLDELKIVADQYDFSTWGLNPVVTLGDTLTEFGAKWIRIDSTDWEFTETFLKWSSNSARSGILTFQHIYLSRATEKDQIMKWVTNTAKAYDKINELKSAANVIVEYSDFQGLALKKVFQYNSLFSDKEIKEMIGSAKSVAAMSQVSLYISTSTQISQKNEDLQKLLVWNQELAKNIAIYPYLLPDSLQNSTAILNHQLTLRLLNFSSAPEFSLAESIVNSMKLSQLDTFIGSIGLLKLALMNQEQINFIQNILKFAEPKLSTYSDPATIKHLKELNAKIAAINVIKQQNFEGTYLLKTEDNQKAKITIAMVSPEKFIVGLSITSEHPTNYQLHFPMFYTSYNLQTETFESHNIRSDDSDFGLPSNPNYYLTFKLTTTPEGKKIDAKFTNGRKIDSFSGLKSAEFNTYPDLPTQKKTPNAVFSGQFKGLGNNFKARLTITSVGDQIAGSLIYGDIRIELPYGYYDKNKNYFVLTKGPRRLGLNWVQLRGQIVGNRVKAQYITGGNGPNHTFVGRFLSEIK
jgi:hypothetical protein